jgi:fumarate reductase flavoprotein subunit
VCIAHAFHESVAGGDRNGDTQMSHGGHAEPRAEAVLSRRTLMLGAGAVALDSSTASRVFGNAQRQAFDLVVIGAGTAGLPAAIFAANRGANVLVVDKAPQVGGTLLLSTGQIAAAGTVFQQRKGIVDSADAHYADVMRINEGTSDPALTRLWADHGGETINWLARRGFTIADDQPVMGKGHDYYSSARYLWGPAGGISILQVLEPALTTLVGQGRISLLLQTAAVDFVTNSRGDISGVVIENSLGRRSDVATRFVLIASGGCAANPTMFECLHNVPLYGQSAYTFSQGAGLMLGVAAGGFIRGGDKYISGFGGVPERALIPSAHTASLMLYPEIRPPWEIFVNADGNRFVQEDHPSVGHRERALDRQPGHRLWVVFDQGVLDRAPTIVPEWTGEKLRAAFTSHPMFTRAPTLRELGVASGVNPWNLERQVAEYNQALDAGAADRFGRAHRPMPIAKPPYYAIRSQGSTVLSFAGLAVNPSLQVITPKGDPVGRGNVYAAGEVLGAGATSGRAYTNGSMVTPALTFGRLLGESLIPL